MNQRPYIMIHPPCLHPGPFAIISTRTSATSKASTYISSSILKSHPLTTPTVTSHTTLSSSLLPALNAPTTLSLAHFVSASTPASSVSRGTCSSNVHTTLGPDVAYDEPDVDDDPLTALGASVHTCGAGKCSICGCLSICKRQTLSKSSSISK
jgi:hypothetical protein